VSQSSPEDPVKMERGASRQLSPEGSEKEARRTRSGKEVPYFDGNTDDDEEVEEDRPQKKKQQQQQHQGQSKKETKKEKEEPGEARKADLSKFFSSKPIVRSEHAPAVTKKSPTDLFKSEGTRSSPKSPPNQAAKPKTEDEQYEDMVWPSLRVSPGFRSCSYFPLVVLSWPEITLIFLTMGGMFGPRSLRSRRKCWRSTQDGARPRLPQPKNSHQRHHTTRTGFQNHH